MACLEQEPAERGGRERERERGREREREREEGITYIIQYTCTHLH